ncbi:MAG TPA: hypothetical protein VND93_33015, partial [Myxococcales bacterium]|nr:hypothetical protein [Myxococcales bacterium]
LELLEDAGSELQREMLNRAVATGHSPTELHSFGDSIRGISDQQLFRLCTPPEDMPARTPEQMEIRLRAEADPILAFRLNRSPPASAAPPGPSAEPKTVPQAEVVQQAVQQTAKAGLKVPFSLSQSYDGSRPIGPAEPTGLLPAVQSPPAKNEPGEGPLRSRGPQQQVRLPAALMTEAKPAPAPQAAPPTPVPPAPRGTPAGTATTGPSPIVGARATAPPPPPPAAAPAAPRPQVPGPAAPPRPFAGAGPSPVGGGPPPSAPAPAAAAPAPAAVSARQIATAGPAALAGAGAGAPAAAAPPPPKKEERKGFADDLFNEAFKPFSLALDEHVIDDEKITVEKVLPLATESLLRGVPVPVVLGSAKGDHRRYALILQVVINPTSRSFQMHDPFAQETVWITDTDLLGLSQLGFAEKAHRRITAITLAKALGSKLA